MKKLRPNQILKMGSDFGNSYTNFVPQKYSGSMHALQYVMLIKLLNLVKPKVVFEFGTYMGNTTRFILENMINFSNETKIVYTIDLDKVADNVIFEGDDKLLASKVLGTQRLYEKSVHKDKVVQLFGDSLNYDFSKIDVKFQFILIDANHALNYVRADTENAFKMLDTSSSHCVVWDDYNHPNFPDLTDYLDELALNGRNIYHIEETNFAILLSDNLVIPAATKGISI